MMLMMLTAYPWMYEGLIPPDVPAVDGDPFRILPPFAVVPGAKPFCELPTQTPFA